MLIYRAVLRVFLAPKRKPRLSATTFGRPTLLRSPYKVPPPEIIDDEAVVANLGEHRIIGQPSRMSFFVYSIKLLGIWDDILEEFYCPWNRDLDKNLVSSSEHLARVHNICRRLDEFVGGLPGHLRDANPGGVPIGSMDACFLMQSKILRSRYDYRLVNSLWPFLCSLQGSLSTTPLAPTISPFCGSTI